MLKLKQNFGISEFSRTIEIVLICGKVRFLIYFLLLRQWRVWILLLTVDALSNLMCTCNSEH